MSAPNLGNLMVAAANLAADRSLPDEDPSRLAGILLVILRDIWDSTPHAERCMLTGVAAQMMRLGMTSVDASGLSIEDYIARLQGRLQ